MSEVEIIMGFNGSGKTLFLNSYLEMKNIKKGEKILILCLDRGNTNFNYNINRDIKVKFIDYHFQINDNKLLYLIEMQKPHFIFIEADYISIKHLNMVLESSILKDKIFIRSRINILNIKHIKNILKNKICRPYSNIIIINNFDEIELKISDLHMLRKLNMNSFVFCVKYFEDLYEKFRDYKLLRNDFYENMFKYIRYLI